MASKLPSVPEITNTATVHYGSGSAVTSSSCPVKTKEAPPLASAIAGEVVARGQLVKEGVTGEEKPTSDMGCQRDSCINQFQGGTTPDLEVNSLTLQPTELWNMRSARVHHAPAHGRAFTHRPSSRGPRRRDRAIQRIETLSSCCT